MSEQTHLIHNIAEEIEELSHGETLTKFVAKGGDLDLFTNGHSMEVELHGFVTSSGNFIILSERFERKEYP